MAEKQLYKTKTRNRRTGYFQAMKMELKIRITLSCCGFLLVLDMVQNSEKRVFPGKV